MRALTSDQIRASFVNCTKGEAKRMTIPRDLDQVPWDDLDFFGWRDPSAPAVGSLVLLRGDDPVGITRRTGSERSASKKQSMCSLCITFHNSGDVALMVARRAGTRGREGNTIGAYMCADLACSLYARGLKKPVRVQPQETLSVEERVARLRLNLDAFVDRVLKG